MKFPSKMNEDGKVYEMAPWVDLLGRICSTSEMENVSDWNGRMKARDISPEVIVIMFFLLL